MLDKSTAISAVYQLWILQFILFFIDYFTNLNIDAYFSLVTYSILINLIFLFSCIYFKFIRLTKIGLVFIGFISLILFILGLIFSNRLFGYDMFYLSNFIFSFLILLMNFNRKFVLGLLKEVNIDFKKNLIIFSCVLFISQFFVNVLWFYFVATVIFLGVLWYYKFDKKYVLYLFLFGLVVFILDLVFGFIYGQINLLFVLVIILIGLGVFYFNSIKSIIKIDFNKIEIKFKSKKKKRKAKKKVEEEVKEEVKSEVVEKKDKVEIDVRDLEYKEFFKKVLPYLFLLSLLVFVVNEFYTLSFVDNNKYWFMGVSVILGSISFWLNREAIDEVEKEKDEEDKKELKRAKEFDKKFKFLTKFKIKYRIKENLKKKEYLLFGLFILLSPFIFIIRLPYSFVKWMYKEGWWYSGALILLIIIGFGLRIWNLDKLPPYPDEYFHLIAARDMLMNLEIPEYTRSFLLVTLPTYFSFLVFGPTIFAGRLVSITFNILAIIPIYYLLKKINKKFALISIFLFISNPWIIAVSKNLREYAVYPFYFMLVILLGFYLLDKFEKNIKLKELRKHLNLNKILLIILFVFPLIYAFIIDSYSTLKIIIITYLVFVFLLLKKIDYKDKFNLFTLAFSSVLALIFIGSTLINNNFITLIPSYNHFWTSFFISNPQQQWYYQKYLIIPIVSLIYSLIYFIRCKNRYFGLYLFSFIFSIYIFLFHFDRYSRPRYGFTLEIWYFIVIGMGIYLLIKHLNILSLKYRRTIKVFLNFIILIIIIILFLNINQIILSTNLDKNYGGTYTPITIEHHIKVNESINFIKNLEKKPELIVLNNLNQIKWYFPYNSVELLQWGCYRDINDDNQILKKYIIENKKIIIGTEWRENRGSCIEGKKLLSNFSLIDKRNHFNIYSNY